MTLEGWVWVALVALALFAAFIAYVIHVEACRQEVDEFDGGFTYNNKPRAITKIKSTFIEEYKE